MSENAPRQPWRSRLWGALVDADPVLARELLVTARTPAYLWLVGAGLLLLAAVVLLPAINAIGRERPWVGREVFQLYFVGLSLALGVVGAGLGSTVVVHEREAGTLDALRLSSLTPRRIILGKWAAVVLAQVAVAACSAPLVWFMIALGAASAAQAAVVVGIAFVAGLMTASVGVGVSAQVANTRRALLVSMVGAAAIGIGVAIWCGLAEDLGPCTHDREAYGLAVRYLERTLDRDAFSVLYVAPAYGFITVLWFGYAMAAWGLMDPSDDRTVPIKRWALGALAIGSITVVARARTAGVHESRDLVAVWMTTSVILGAVLIFAFAGEPVRPTRRMLAHPGSLLRARGLAPSILFAVGTVGGVVWFVRSVASISADIALRGLWAAAFLATVGGIVGTMAARRGAKRARMAGAVVALGLPIVTCVLHRDGEPPSVFDTVCPLWLSGDDAVARGVIDAGLAVWACAGAVSLAVMLYAVRARPAKA